MSEADLAAPTYFLDAVISQSVATVLAFRHEDLG